MCCRGMYNGEWMFLVMSYTLKSSALKADVGGEMKRMKARIIAKIDMMMGLFASIKSECA